LNGKGNREPLVDVDVPDINEVAGKQLDLQVGVAGRADSDGVAAEALEVEPALADERACVAPRLGVEPPEDLEDQLVRQGGVDVIAASHLRNEAYVCLYDIRMYMRMQIHTRMGQNWRSL